MMAGERAQFEVLNGLRGVAALLVVVFHVSEILSLGDPRGNLFPHGALAVDFFFCLSGFVVSYAYDQRWARGMGLREFALRRLIRLHPLVLPATVMGALVYAFAPFRGADWTVSPADWAMTIAFALLVLPYPTLPGRFDDTHSLDGPTWTLFQEYIGNLAYALVLRHLSPRALLLLAVPAAVGLAAGAAHYGSVSTGFGYSNWWMAEVRLAFPFIFGLWMHRVLPALPKVRLGLLPLAAVMIGALALPVMGPDAKAASNGLFEAALVIVLFPLIVLCGAHSGGSPRALATSSALGRLSYPLYILHYPFIYKFADWVILTEPKADAVLPVALALPPLLIALGWAGLKLWDEPVRARLSARYLARR